MKLVTPAEMRSLDERTIEEFKVPGPLLMERAGWGAIQALQRHLQPGRRRVDVFCGSGNNGGDGYVMARYLRLLGHKVRVWHVGDPRKLTPDCAFNRKRVQREKIDIRDCPTASDLPTLDELDGSVAIDALLGTGSQGAPRDPVATAIRLINSMQAFRLAVDIPSGVSGRDGSVAEDLAVEADLTVTFGLPKVGQLLYPGKAYVGRLQIVDIGLASRAVDELPTPARAALDEVAVGLLPERDPRGFKTTFGKLAIFAGSAGLSGAAILAGRAALRVGTGLVCLAGPRSQVPTFTLGSPECAKRGLPEVRRLECLSTRALGDVMALLKEYPISAIGPGLGRHHETMELVRRLLPRLPASAVLDADGLYALKGQPALLKDLPHSIILTPHPGEFATIFGGTATEVAAAPIESALRAAAETGQIILLKGAPSVLALPGGEYWLNGHGNDGMATGGSGDVLTGCIGGFLAQEMAAPEAALLGMIVHSMAGDRAAERLGRRGMVAGDIVRALPRVMMELEAFEPLPELPERFEAEVMG